MTPIALKRIARMFPRSPDLGRSPPARAGSSTRHRQPSGVRRSERRMRITSWIADETTEPGSNLAWAPFWPGDHSSSESKPNALHTTLNFCSSLSSLHLLAYICLTVSSATFRSSRFDVEKTLFMISSRLKSA